MVETIGEKTTLEDIFYALNEIVHAIDDHRDAVVCVSFDHEHSNPLLSFPPEKCSCVCH